MRVLFDNGVPRGLATALRQHAVEEARAHGWDTLENGDLLTAAEAEGFEVFVTTDRNQQNLSARRIAIVVLTRASWPLIQRRLSLVAAAVDTVMPGGFVEVDVSPESRPLAPLTRAGFSLRCALLAAGLDVESDNPPRVSLFGIGRGVAQAHNRLLSS